MNSKQMIRKLTTALLMTAFLSASISTAVAEKGRKGPPRGKPPVEAFTACENLTEEDVCSFETPEGETIEGICIVPRGEEEGLVCKPKRGQHKDKPNRNRY